MFRLLCLAPHTPEPARNAADCRLVRLLALLPEDWVVDLATPDTPTSGINDSSGSPDFPRPWNSHTWGDWYLQRALSRTRYDLILAEYYWHAERTLPTVRRWQPRVPFVVDSVDLHFVRETAAAELGLANLDSAEVTRRRELAIYRKAEAVIAITRAEFEVLNQAGGIRAVHVIPLIYPTRAITHTGSSESVLFIGGFGHTPNVDGIRWFLSDIWPLVRSTRPQATLRIVGTAPPPDVQAAHGLNGVEVLGYVPETRHVLADSSVLVAPLRFGAGMKGKVVEAMAAGVPVVTTRFGIEGIPGETGQHFRLAEDAASFAIATCDLLADGDEARMTGLRGQQLIASICAPEAVREQLGKLLSTVPPPSWALVDRLQWQARVLGFGVLKAAKSLASIAGIRRTSH